MMQKAVSQVNLIQRKIKLNKGSKICPFAYMGTKTFIIWYEDTRWLTHLGKIKLED